MDADDEKKVIEALKALKVKHNKADTAEDLLHGWEPLLQEKQLTQVMQNQ